MIDELERKNHFRNLRTGIGYVVLTTIFFALIFALSKLAKGHTPVPVFILFQCVISLFFLVPWVASHGIASFKTEHLGMMFVRGAAYLGSITMMFFAVQETSLVDATLLNNSAPLVLPFLLYFWRKTPINHKLWPGLIAGFVGIAFILDPGREIFNPGGLLAAGSAFTFATVMISSHLLSKTDRHHVVVFYTFIVASALVLPFAIYTWQTPSWEALFKYLIPAGIFSGCAQLTFARAYHYAKASHLGPFFYGTVVFSGVIEWLLFDKVPSFWTFIGFVCVCAGGVLTILFSAPESKK